jgi:hypothetical protein
LDCNLLELTSTITTLKILTLPANIRLGNNHYLAYLASVKTGNEKCFMTLKPGTSRASASSLADPSVSSAPVNEKMKKPKWSNYKLVKFIFCQTGQISRPWGYKGSVLVPSSHCSIHILICYVMMLMLSVIMLRAIFLCIIMQMPLFLRVIMHLRLI